MKQMLKKLAAFILVMMAALSASSQVVNKTTFKEWVKFKKGVYVQGDTLYIIGGGDTTRLYTYNDDVYFYTTADSILFNKPTNITGGGGGAPSGPAGGDLFSTYPNPKVGGIIGYPIDSAILAGAFGGDKYEVYYDYDSQSWIMDYRYAGTVTDVAGSSPVIVQPNVGVYTVSVDTSQKGFSLVNNRQLSNTDSVGTLVSGAIGAGFTPIDTARTNAVSRVVAGSNVTVQMQGKTAVVSASGGGGSSAGSQHYVQFAGASGGSFDASPSFTYDSASSFNVGGGNYETMIRASFNSGSIILGDVEGGGNNTYLLIDDGTKSFFSQADSIIYSSLSGGDGTVITSNAAGKLSATSLTSSAITDYVQPRLYKSLHIYISEQISTDDPIFFVFADDCGCGTVNITRIDRGQYRVTIEYGVFIAGRTFLVPPQMMATNQRAFYKIEDIDVDQIDLFTRDISGDLDDNLIDTQLFEIRIYPE